MLLNKASIVDSHIFFGQGRGIFPRSFCLLIVILMFFHVLLSFIMLKRKRWLSWLTVQGGVCLEALMKHTSAHASRCFQMDTSWCYLSKESVLPFHLSLLGRFSMVKKKTRRENIGEWQTEDDFWTPHKILGGRMIAQWKPCLEVWELWHTYRQIEIRRRAVLLKPGEDKVKASKCCNSHRSYNSKFGLYCSKQRRIDYMPSRLSVWSGKWERLSPSQWPEQSALYLIGNLGATCKILQVFECV